MQAFVTAIETRDRDTIARSLADHARQVFPMAKGGWTRKDWTVSADGMHVFMQAKSDAVVAYSGKPYRNTYVTLFDVADGEIVRITEYAISALCEATGIDLSPAMLRAIDRAQSMSEDAIVS